MVGERLKRVLFSAFVAAVIPALSFTHHIFATKVSSGNDVLIAAFSIFTKKTQYFIQSSIIWVLNGFENEREKKNCREGTSF